MADGGVLEVRQQEERKDPLPMHCFPKLYFTSAMAQFIMDILSISRWSVVPNSKTVRDHRYFEHCFPQIFCSNVFKDGLKQGQKGRVQFCF